MQAGQKADDVCPALLLPSPKGVLGLTTLSQYIYVFFPEKIRVYEQLPLRPSPELVEEIYLSKKNICRFAVSQEFIAVLFQDSGLEVRLREYWEVVQYSSSLQEPSGAIDSLEIDDHKVYYRFKKEQENQPTFGFVDLSDKVQQIQYWQQTKPLQKLIHRHKLGSIPDFYVSLMDNQIRFGMYYQEQPTILKEFEFGTLNEADPENKVISVHLLQSQEIRKQAQSQKKDLFLVKLVEEGSSKKQGKKKGKNKEKANNMANIEDNRKLKLKYIKFFEEEVHYPSEEQNITAEDKKFKVFEQMLHSMQQIQANTNCEKSDFFGNLSNSPPIQSHPSRDKDLWKSFDVPLFSDQFESFDIIRKGSTLYLNTGTQIISFCFKQTPCLKLVQQLPKNEPYYKVKDICQHGLILYGKALFSMPFHSSLPKGEDEKPKEAEKKLKEFPKQKSPQSSGSKQENKIAHNIPLVERAMQTQLPTDIYLDQFEEEQLSEIIDKLFEKKKVFDQETQTEPLKTSEFQIQTEANDDQLNKENQRKEEEQVFTQNQQQNEVILKAEICYNDQQTQIQIEKVEYLEKGVGEYLPLCPECHHCSLTAISKSLKKIQQNSGNKWSNIVKETLKQEQQKIKTDAIAKIKSIIDSIMGEKVIPIVEANLRTILDQKLAEVNSYIYSLIMNNLVTLNQELEKDVARQTGIRNQLMKKQMHEIEQSKRAVAQMVQICKVREIQKIVFFEDISKKFQDIEQKVAELEGKVTVLAKSHETRDDGLYEEIENIKNMLLQELKLEGGSIESQGEERDDELDEGQLQNEDQDEEASISSEEFDSSEEQVENSLAVNVRHSMMRAPNQFGPPPFVPQQQPYWPQPPHYSYYPPQYSPYQSQYYMPPPPQYQVYPSASFHPPVAQPPMPKPSKKLALPAREQFEMYSIPMEAMHKSSKPIKRKRK